MDTNGTLFWKNRLALNNMEYGSFIDLDLRDTGEYFEGD